MPPFKQKFDTRHDIPGMIFSEAIQMLLYHELAHIGGGHLDLKVADPEYGNNPDVQITEKDEADNQAICWLLDIRFLESPSNILEIGADDLKEEKKAKADAQAAGKRDECGRDSGKAEINKKTNNKNKCRVDKLNSRSSHGIF